MIAYIDLPDASCLAPSSADVLLVASLPPARLRSEPFVGDHSALDDPDLVFQREGSGFARLDCVFEGERQQVLESFNDPLWPLTA